MDELISNAMRVAVMPLQLCESTVKTCVSVRLRPCLPVFHPQGGKVAMTGLCDGRFVLCVRATLEAQLGMIRAKV